MEKRSRKRNTAPQGRGREGDSSISASLPTNEALLDIMRELNAPDPRTAVRTFRELYPNQPLPSTLKPYEKNAPKIVRPDSPYSVEKQIEAFVQQELDEEPTIGGQTAPFHDIAFSMIDYHVSKNASIGKAVKLVRDELNRGLYTDKPYHIDEDSLYRAYQRHCRRRIEDQIAQAIVDRDEAAYEQATKARRDRNQRNWRLPKK